METIAIRLKAITIRLDAILLKSLLTTNSSLEFTPLNEGFPFGLECHGKNVSLVSNREAEVHLLGDLNPTP